MSGRTPTGKSIRKPRKESNEQLMRAAIGRWGTIRIRISLSFYVPKTRQFVGWHGSGIMIDVNSLESAHALYDGLQNAIANAARKTGTQVRPPSITTLSY
jgi:hypothetical protein